MVQAGHMSRPGPEIRLSTKEKEILLRWMRSPKTEQRMVQRATVILLASEGLSGKEIASKMRTREARISKWLGRFAKSESPGSLTKSVREKSAANTTPRAKSESSKRSMNPCRKATAVGMGGFWPSTWAM